MDAVRTAVERLGGRVTDREPAGAWNHGSVDTAPFTVMMTRVMSVEAAGQAAGLPLDLVVETALIARERVVPIGAARAFVGVTKPCHYSTSRETLGLAGATVNGAGARCDHVGWQPVGRS